MWTSLCHLDELTEGFGKYVEVGGFQLAVFLSDGRVYVLDNTCPHAGAPLGGGHVEDGCAVCPRHNWMFRLDSGELRDMPGFEIRTYPVRTIDHDSRQLIQADLPAY